MIRSTCRWRKGTRELLNKAGLKTVIDERYSTNASDFSVLLSRIKSENADAVLVAGHETEILNFIRQAKSLDVSPKLYSFTVGAEIEPNQKERIILALKKAGNVVGYMGDGINDASPLHAADVGISVESAVDVAKGAADIVLLEKDLGVLVQGVREGRTTFANTLKYVFMATSGNFGNMFSMAGVSLFLPFLPLLPKQILLT